MRAGSGARPCAGTAVRKWTIDLDDQTHDHKVLLRLWSCSDCGHAQLADDADLPEQPHGARQTRPCASAAARTELRVVGLLHAGATVAEGALLTAERGCRTSPA
jgi:hypothetical protein